MSITKTHWNIAKTLLRKTAPLTGLTTIKYNGFMMTKPRVSPKVFEAIKRDYEEAAEQRRKEMYRLYHEEGWTQQEIAEYFGVDISRANKVIRQLEDEE